MELNESYRIVYDTENVILQFHEVRENTKKEMQEYKQDSYYPSLAAALRGFLIKCTWGIKSAKEVLEVLERVELLISKIK